MFYNKPKHYDLTDISNQRGIFYNFLKILKQDFNEKIFDKKINRYREKTKDEKRNIGNRIIKKLDFYYSQNKIIYFGLLFHSISNLTINKKLDIFFHERILPIIKNYNMKNDTLEKIVTFRFKKNEKDCEFTPIDKLIFKGNISIARTLLNYVNKCSEYRNIKNESLLDIINYKINLLENKADIGNYYYYKKNSTSNEQLDSAYYEISGLLVELKLYIEMRIRDEINPITIRKYVPKKIRRQQILIKRKRLLLGLLKTHYLLIKAYKSSKEKLYHPNSSYVNNTLKKNFYKSKNKSLEIINDKFDKKSEKKVCNKKNKLDNDKNKLDNEKEKLDNEKEKLDNDKNKLYNDKSIITPRSDDTEYFFDINLEKKKPNNNNNNIYYEIENKLWEKKIHLEIYMY